MHAEYLVAGLAAIISLDSSPRLVHVVEATAGMAKHARLEVFIVKADAVGTGIPIAHPSSKSVLHHIHGDLPNVVTS